MNVKIQESKDWQRECKATTKTTQISVFHVLLLMFDDCPKNRSSLPQTKNFMVGVCKPENLKSLLVWRVVHWPTTFSPPFYSLHLSPPLVIWEETPHGLNHWTLTSSSSWVVVNGRHRHEIGGHRRRTHRSGFLHLLLLSRLWPVLSWPQLPLNGPSLLHHANSQVLLLSRVLLSHIDGKDSCANLWVPQHPLILFLIAQYSGVLH